MEEKKTENHDSFAWAAIEQAKNQTRLWFIVFLVTFAGLIGTNIAWIYTWQLYDTISQDGSGINNFNNDIGGDVFNGAEDQNQE